MEIAMTKKRISLSKKMRFDVFKRDGFKCVYCGRQPPHVTLEVDYLAVNDPGGPDSIDNYATSCPYCNQPSSLQLIPLSLELHTASLEERKEQYVALQRQVHEIERRVERSIYEVELVFQSYFSDGEFTAKFKNTVKMFIARLGLAQVKNAMEISCDKIISPSLAEQYFCGICWKKVRDIEHHQNTRKLGLIDPFSH